MIEKFQEKAFTPRSLDMIEKANAIIASYVAQGYDLSVRQLHYQFVARNLYRNTPENYGKLQSLVSEARMAGLIDWDHIRDRSRVTYYDPGHQNLRAFLMSKAESFVRSKWGDQPNYVEVMVEKQAAEGVLLPVCRRWDVAFTATKGYGSQSMLYERSKYLQSQRDVEGKDVHIIYLGDHDPSGIDMTRDLRERLELFTDGPVEVHRVALNIDQVRRHNVPDNFAKREDPRSAEYREQYGDFSWEMDALEPSILAGLVENRIKSLIDLSKWNPSKEREEADRERLQDIIDALPK